MLFTSIYRKKINAAEALIPLVAFNFKTYLFFYIFGSYSAICQFVHRYAYANQLAAHISAQIAAWLNSCHF